MQHLRSKSLFSRKIIACTRKKVKRRAAGRRRPYAPISSVKRVVLRRQQPPVRPAGGFLLVRIYGDSFLYNLRVILESYSTDETRTLFFSFFASFFLFSKESGGSPPTLRPNFKCEKGNVTAGKPPVHPAWGFLLTKIYKAKKPPLKGEAISQTCKRRKNKSHPPALENA